MMIIKEHVLFFRFIYLHIITELIQTGTKTYASVIRVFMAFNIIAKAVNMH